MLSIPRIISKKVKVSKAIKAFEVKRISIFVLIKVMFLNNVFVFNRKERKDLRKDR